jgi:peptide/nickel transport system substrate-binding protein
MRMRSVLFASLFSLGALSIASAQEITTVGEAQDKIVISGGVDVVGLSGLDAVAIVPDKMLMAHIADTLLRTDKDGKLLPWLITSWTPINDLTWEIKLRQGVKFQNGEPFNAEAIKFFYDLMADPKFSTPAKSNHSWVKNTEIVDDYTVRLTTKEPYPTAPNQFPSTFAVPPKYIKEVGFDAYRKRPVGAGPYRVTEYVRDDHLTMEAFDGWWAGKPKIKTIIYRPIREDAARVSALLTHEIDLAFDIPPELMSMVETGKDVAIKRVLSSRSYMLWFNNIDKSYPTTNAKVREAINYAVDREGLNKAIFADTGGPTAWLNPTTFGIDPSLKPVPYDPERAKKLLAEAGYPNGFDVVMDTPDGRYIKDKEYGQAIAGQLAKVGIRARATPYEWSVFTKRMWGHQSSPITLMAWVDSVNDPDAQNRRILVTDGTWSQYSDPKLDALMKRIESEMNPEARKALIFEQQKYMRESWPVAYLQMMGTVTAVSSKLSWFQPVATDAHKFYRLNIDEK